jgi:hypothetical protein
MNEGFRFGVVRGVSYGLFGAPDRFVQQAGALGASVVRIYIYWSQVEPEEGSVDLSVVDHLIEQLTEPGPELWVTVCSASPWGTQVPTTFQPQSPPRDLARYRRFLTTLVRRCGEHVAYWQCNNEPSNAGLLWSGSAAEYIDQLRVFADVVRREAPSASVVLGGCGYDVLSSPAGSRERQFFDVLARDGRDHFDLFDLHLYDDVGLVPAHVETARGFMRAHGYERPVVIGEYAGPSMFDFPEVQKALEEVMTTAFAAPRADETPDRTAMRLLYDRADEWPDSVRMFMEDPPPELVALRERIACRLEVTRSVMVLACGVPLVLRWSLAPEIGGYRDRLNMLGFLSDTFALMEYAEGRIAHEHPPAATLRRTAAWLTGARGASRLPTEDSLHAYEIDTDRPLHVLWRDGDLVAGDRTPPVPVDHPWPYPRAVVEDPFGLRRQLAPVNGRLRLPTSVTPLVVHD